MPRVGLRLGPGLTSGRGGNAWWPAGASMALDFRGNRAFGVSMGDITTTRASGGTALDLAGNVVSFGNNEPRWTGRGLLVEAAATRINDGDGTQSRTVTAVAHTLSFWGTGTVTLTGVSTAGPLVGTGALNRVQLTFTPSAGSLTMTISGTVTNMQLETGSVASSYISGAGAGLTRAFDNIFIPSIDSAEWFSAARTTEGVFVGTYRDLNNSASLGAICALNAGGAYVAPSSFAVRHNNATVVNAISSSVAVSVTVPTWAGRRRVAGGYRTSDNRYSISEGGANFNTGTSGDYTGVGTTRLQLGAINGTAGQTLNGYIENLAFIPTAGLLASGATMNPLTVLV